MTVRNSEQFFHEEIKFSYLSVTVCILGDAVDKYTVKFTL